jgi:Tol biopolymer transport system component
MVRYSSASPDGQWIAYFGSYPQEDLFLIRPDGSGVRQLTRDAFKDRNPVWSPDGSHILFYSNRGGKWNAWSIRPDGSALEPLTQSGEITVPLWSPDGRRIACSYGGHGTAIIDLAQPPEKRVPQLLPAGPSGDVFSPSSWSPDGRWLVGTSFLPGASAVVPGLFLYSLTDQRSDQRTQRLTDRGNEGMWLRDNRHIVYVDDGKLRGVDSRTRQSRELLRPVQGAAYLSVSLAPGDRALYVVRSTREGDIGMVSLP